MPLCLIYHPRVVATAALLLAWHFSYDNQPPTHWWTTTGLDPGEINGKKAKMDMHSRNTTAEYCHRVGCRYVGLLSRALPYSKAIVYTYSHY